MNREECLAISQTASLKKILHLLQDCAYRGATSCNFLKNEENFFSFITDEVTAQLQQLGYTCELIGDKYFVSWDENDKHIKAEKLKLEIANKEQ